MQSGFFKHIRFKLPKQTTMQRCRYAFSLFLTVSCIVAPYLVVGILTKFRRGESTPFKRRYMIAWVVYGQLYGLVLHTKPALMHSLQLVTVLAFTLVATFIGLFGFYHVGAMMVGDDICIKI